jgi:hypothetical protein
MTHVTRSGPEFPENIDLYSAGAELDCLLAEHVLGAKIGRYKDWGGYENVVATDPDGAKFYIMVSPHSLVEPLWNPSTNLSDAHVLVRYLYMHSEYRSITEEGTDEDGYSATLWAHRPLDVDMAVTALQPRQGRQWVEISSVAGSGPTPALAVCRAVYKAASAMSPRQVDTE